MIDIHCHILPGLDDGPTTEKEALKMARIAVKDGIRTIIATPHCCDGRYDCQQYNIPDHCTRFNDLLKLKKIDLTVLPGAEIALTPDLPDLIQQERVIPLTGSGNRFLIELPLIFVADGVAHTFQALKDQGITILLAHPERNPLLSDSPEALQQLITAGVYLQLTAGSILGCFGKPVQAIALQLLQMPVPCYLGSDGHNSGKRKPQLRKAKNYVQEIIGKKGGDFHGFAEF